MKHSFRRILSLLMVITLLAFPASGSAVYEKLQKGDEGAAVLNMQAALQSLGYDLKADGKYGAGTLSTVKRFQRKYGLSADGVAGDKTLTLLYALAPAYRPDASINPAPQPTAAPAATVTYSPPSSMLTAWVSTASGSLNLRQGPSSTARVLAAIPYGDMMVVVGKGAEWSAVIYNGITGYVMTRFLSFGEKAYNPVTASPAPTLPPAPTPQLSPANTQAMVTTTGGTLNLRETPSSAARILQTVPYGAWVTVTARGDTWCAVLYNNVKGYVMTRYLSFGVSQPVASPTPAPTYYAAPPAAGETAYVATTGGSLNLRESANGAARVLATIPNGYPLTVTSRGSVWCGVIYQGRAGYVMTSFLRFDAAQPTAAPTPKPADPPAQSGAAAYVNTSAGSLNLRQSPQSNARILTTIPYGAQVTLISRGSAWCAVQYNGISGYVMTAFLAFPGAAATPAPTATPLYLPTYAPPSNTASGVALITTSGGALNLRAEPSSSARVQAAIPNASSVTVYSRGAEWSEISYNGTRGYVMSRYLTFLNISAPTPAAGAEDDDPSAYTRALKKGMTGSDVAWVQNRLAELGYQATVTNLYDDATFAAVKAFQTQNGLEADGIAGSQTFAILKSGSARKASASPLTYATVRIDETGAAVRQIQTDLKALGYQAAVNGTYDEATHNAVVAFQQRNGLVISGIADGLTRQILHGGGGKPYSTPVTQLPASEGHMTAPALNELKLLHWQEEIKPNVKAGQTFTIFDPNTNLSWKLVFYSLGRHADSQPASWRDTQIMNRSFGDTSWTIHPVYVLLPTGQWTMATMHNRPHLYGSITDNGFGGHLCVHFLRDMAEAQKNDPNYGVNNQVTLRNAWKALTGETVN